MVGNRVVRVVRYELERWKSDFISIDRYTTGSELEGNRSAQDLHKLITQSLPCPRDISTLANAAETLNMYYAYVDALSAARRDLSAEMLIN